MSLHETPMTLWYWEQVGGTLIEEFTLVPKGNSNGKRVVDAVIILGTEKIRLPLGSKVNLTGKDVIVVQTKCSKLGMYLLGQTYFSRDLIIKYHKPNSVRSVALCSKADAILQELLESYKDCEVVVYEKKMILRIL